MIRTTVCGLALVLSLVAISCTHPDGTPTRPTEAAVAVTARVLQDYLATYSLYVRADGASHVVGSAGIGAALLADGSASVEFVHRDRGVLWSHSLANGGYYGVRLSFDGARVQVLELPCASAVTLWPSLSCPAAPIGLVGESPRAVFAVDVATGDATRPGCEPAGCCPDVITGGADCPGE